MGLGAALEAMSFDGPGEAPSLAGADDVDGLARLEDVDFDFLALFDVLVDVTMADAEFAQIAQRGQVVALQMSQLPLGEALGFGFLVAKLDGEIAVTVDGTNLGDIAGPGLDDGDGNGIAFVVKDLGHTHFFTDYALHKI